MYDLEHCRVCKKPLSAQQIAYAKRRHEPQLCSTECNKAEIKKHFGCCDMAEQTFCVCMYSFSCPVHGQTHIGTHD